MDRNSESAARAIIETICPAANARRAWVALVSRSIEAAAAVSQASWGTTLFPDLVRLNVGQIAVLDLFAGGLAICTEGKLAGRTRGIRVQVEWPGFAAVQVATERWIVSPQAAVRIPSELIEAHLQLVQTAAMAKGRSPFRKSHSPGVVAYIHAEDPKPHMLELEASSQPRAFSFGDPERNVEVERAAVSVVSNHYASAGWRVISVEAAKIGYDLKCSQGRKELHVEVKGCSSLSDHFTITGQELRAALNDDSFVLALVDGIRSGDTRLRVWDAGSFRRDFALEPQRYWAVLKGAS